MQTARRGGVYLGRPVLEASSPLNTIQREGLDVFLWISTRRQTRLHRQQLLRLLWPSRHENLSENIW